MIIQWYILYLKDVTFLNTYKGPHKMKMTAEHYETIKTAMQTIPVVDLLAHRDYIIAEGKAQDVDKRLRWDCLHASGVKLGDGRGCSGLPVYSYLHDSHIDTALKQIIKELGI